MSSAEVTAAADEGDGCPRVLLRTLTTSDVRLETSDSTMFWLVAAACAEDKSAEAAAKVAAAEGSTSDTTLEMTDPKEARSGCKLGGCDVLESLEVEGD